MKLRKILFIVALLVILGSVQNVKAQTMEEISAQISALQTKIAAYQKELTELQTRISVIQNEIIKLRAEMAELLRKQISLVQNQIAQLQAQLAKPESEWKCPDLNGDGIVDVKDVGLVSKAVDTCLGQANYNPVADVDYDNCITKADVDYVAKYFGKKIEDITQCKGVVKPLAKPESEWKCPDLNGDGIVDGRDVGLVSKAVDTCLGQANYNPVADVDYDNCITKADVDYVAKYFGKKSEDITQCAVTQPTLRVTISASPSSGVMPLTGVDLTANVFGTATGSINYTFYCNRSDTGTNITSGWCQKKDGITQTSYTAVDCCNFSTAGNYTAKVIVERENLQAENRVNIQVSAKPESEWKCPDLNGDGIVDGRDVGLVSKAVDTCLGQANYNPVADVDYDNCITMADVNYVANYFGKKSEDISQCKKEATLKYIENTAASISEALSRLMEEAKRLIGR
jgi:hypothetical protein